jgi:hypothetical protein
MYARLMINNKYKGVAACHQTFKKEEEKKKDLASIIDVYNL